MSVQFACKKMERVESQRTRGWDWWSEGLGFVPSSALTGHRCQQQVTFTESGPPCLASMPSTLQAHWRSSWQPSEVGTAIAPDLENQKRRAGEVPCRPRVRRSSCSQAGGHHLPWVLEMFLSLGGALSTTLFRTKQCCLRTRSIFLKRP